MGYPQRDEHADFVPGVVGPVDREWFHVLQGCQLGNGRERLSQRASVLVHGNGLAPGEYAVYVRARYEDFQNGPFRKSAKVVVGSAQQQEEETPTPVPTEAPTPEPAPEPTAAAGAITGLTLTSSRPGQLFISWDESIPRLPNTD